MIEVNFSAKNGGTHWYIWATPVHRTGPILPIHRKWMGPIWKWDAVAEVLVKSEVPVRSAP